MPDVDQKWFDRYDQQVSAINAELNQIESVARELFGPVPSEGGIGEKPQGRAYELEGRLAGVVRRLEFLTNAFASLTEIPVETTTTAKVLNR